MLELAHLYKSFKDKLILKDINLKLEKGKIIAIIGSSGAGKSTLLRCINLLEIPTSGSLRLDNLSLDFKHINKKDIAAFRQKTAMVFQHHNLFINKNAIENVAEALIVVKKMPKKQAFELAYEKLELVGLKDKLYSYAFELSGGQAQRVGIARALAVNPSLMLFDEPTSALDAELVGEVLEVIKNIKDQSMLIVTHELNFAKSVADEIVFMSEGEILEQSLTQDFFKKPKHPRVKQFLARFDNEDFCI
ncbi:amino acid ABC transporter ATP-binding protein [Campylobacter sp. MIT 97-5078]|uniref:amino acid ABC transporter ATP-binding protein n=4 Tax=Campylobacter sp. MIT 97-5078 TaxID=1548153 RepID=UPI0005140390|nr:amino acid ABC transporter ATP-binding protein [Campylobacter sp. MIT 97-5078]KGI56891.1 hypothetical protein LR59_05340 [Campylobacter sp. MIT 97-5078]KGI56898.1 hypothetical protein LR59_05385 [Campylobacter sp. MIT 97-5078]TQR26722.1 amino acid ABC transporter ATP-binding protein [Campylobacter sp. MIT 97-5078]